MPTSLSLTTTVGSCSKRLRLLRLSNESSDSKARFLLLSSLKLLESKFPILVDVIKKKAFWMNKLFFSSLFFNGLPHSVCHWVWRLLMRHRFVTRYCHEPNVPPQSSITSALGDAAFYRPNSTLHALARLRLSMSRINLAFLISNSLSKNTKSQEWLLTLTLICCFHSNISICSYRRNHVCKGN